MALQDGLVPARFLTLVAHLVLTIMMFWTKDDNVLQCFTEKYNMSLYESLNTQIIVALSISVVLFAFELVGFLSGISTFIVAQSIFSLCCHSAGAISMSYMVLEKWCSTDFWFVFGFTIVFPMLTEVLTIIAVLVCRKGPY